MKRLMISCCALLLIALFAPSGLLGQQKSAGKTTEPPAKRKRVVSNLGFEMGGQTQTAQPVQTVGATRGDVSRPVPAGPTGSNAPVLFAPQLGRSYSTRPTFFWRLPEGAKSAKLVLSDGSRDVGAWEVTGNSFTLPADAPELKPGEKYFWRIELPDGSRSATLGLAVVGGSERQALATELAAADRLRNPLLAGNERASLFTEHKLWYDVLGEYSKLIAQFPNETSLYEKRGQVYAQLPATQPEADADFARAEQH